MFDLVMAVALTAAAATAIAVVTLSMAREAGARIRLATALVTWFAVVVVLGATRALSPDVGLGTPGLGLTVALPALTLTFLALGTPRGRAALAEAPLPALIGLHTIRVLGVTFLLLYTAGRLPAPFALAAGWGDIATGLAAPFVAWGVAHGRSGSPAIALGWNVFGLLDLVAAVSLGVITAPGPLRVFMGEPSSAMMNDLPMLLIPGFLVPLLISTHLALFARLAGAARLHQRPAAA
jgi:hypothetical protein